jgi:hypothetical protein
LWVFFGFLEIRIMWERKENYSFREKLRNKCLKQKGNLKIWNKRNRKLFFLFKIIKSKKYNRSIAIKIFLIFIFLKNKILLNFFLIINIFLFN